LEDLRLTRLDASVNFSWGGLLHSLDGPGRFYGAVDWEIEPLWSEDYTFITMTVCGCGWTASSLSITDRAPPRIDEGFIHADRRSTAAARLF
jgi:hypothetical protein